MPARLFLLGAFRLEVSGNPVAVPLGSQRLLAFLALSGRTTRAVTAATLWPELTELRAQASLRSAIWRLRRPRAGLVEPGPGTLALGAGVTVDARDVAGLARRVAAAPGDLPDAELIGLTSVRVLLPGWYDDWVLTERENLVQLQLCALEAAAEQLASRARYPAAVQAALRVVQADPLRESAHRALIRVRLAEGNNGDAVRQYQTCRQLLSSELGVEPSAQTLQLLRTVSATRSR